MAAPVYTGGLPFIKGGLRTKFKVKASGAATVQLTRSQSNGMFLFDTASGIVYTLPTAVPGLYYQFAATVTVTAASYKVITKNATEFLVGEVEGFNTASADAQLGFHGDGTSHIALTQQAAGTNATGGLIGSWVWFLCLTATQWLTGGSFLAGTTASTPFASS